MNDDCKQMVEIFGPVLFIKKIENINEAVDYIKQSDYGLMCYIWSNDIEKAKNIAFKLNCGFVVINDVIKDITNPYLPFGGNKKSGFGRYNGKEGLYEFSQVCSISYSSPKWYFSFEKLPNFYKLVRFSKFYYKIKSFF